MRNFIVYITLLCCAQVSSAAQWITLTPADIENIQVIQANNSNGSPEGLYIALKNDITGEAASYCSRKNFIAINDPKLIDRTYSGVLLAISSQKTFQLYIDGAGKCLSNGPLATMFMLKP
jgi:hypothetical protein